MKFTDLFLLIHQANWISDKKTVYKYVRDIISIRCDISPDMTLNVANYIRYNAAFMKKLARKTTNVSQCDTTIKRLIGEATEEPKSNMINKLISILQTIDTVDKGSLIIKLESGGKRIMVQIEDI